jgi:hypothetical protein
MPPRDAARLEREALAILARDPDPDTLTGYEMRVLRAYRDRIDAVLDGDAARNGTPSTHGSEER